MLTEPTWFKGSLDDLEAARAAVADRATRPLLLRKDFVVHRVQVLEARAYGADTVLLMVSVLHTLDAVSSLLRYCRELGMEPLVEVVSEAEMDVALDAGALVIGINTRDLNTFAVDMTKTPRLVAHAASRCSLQDRGVSMLSLSGIKTRADVVPFEEIGIRGVLVGEALMRAPSPKQLIHHLVTPAAASDVPPVLVKVCGVRDVDAAVAAAQAGAHLIGVIMVPGTRRYVSEDAAKAICAAVQTFREKDPAAELQAAQAAAAALGPAASSLQWYHTWHKALAGVAARVRPLVVGVFQNQPIEDVNRVAAAVGLDVVQLHGDEGFDACTRVHKPCIRVVHVAAPATDVGVAPLPPSALSPAAIMEQLKPRTAAMVLLDAKVGATAGGSGVSFDWTVAAAVRAGGFPVLLAGGLSPTNVAAAVLQTHAAGVDVSSGVETDGVKDAAKIREYVKAALAAGDQVHAADAPEAAEAAASTHVPNPAVVPSLARQRTDIEHVTQALAKPGSGAGAGTSPIAAVSPATMRRQVTDPLDAAAAAAAAAASGEATSLSYAPGWAPPAPALARQVTDPVAPATSSLAPGLAPSFHSAPAALDETRFRELLATSSSSGPSPTSPGLPDPVPGVLESLLSPHAAAAFGARVPPAVQQAATFSTSAPAPPSSAPVLGRQPTDIEGHTTSPRDRAASSGVAHDYGAASAHMLPPQAAVPMLARQVTDPVPPAHAPPAAAAPVLERQPTDIEGSTSAGERAAASGLAGGFGALAPPPAMLARQVTDPFVQSTPAALPPSSAPVLGRQPTDIEGSTTTPRQRAAASGVAHDSDHHQASPPPPPPPILARQVTDPHPQH